MRGAYTNPPKFLVSGHVLGRSIKWENVMLFTLEAGMKLLFKWSKTSKVGKRGSGVWKSEVGA